MNSTARAKAKKRGWEIGATVALVCVLGASTPAVKEAWEQYSAYQEVKNSILRQIRGGYFEDVHEISDSIRRFGLEQETLASESDQLCLAVSVGDIEQLKSLLNQGADPNAGTTARRWSILGNDLVYARITPLWLAAGYGDLETVKVLLSHGADVETSDGEPWHDNTALMRAANAGNAKVVESLLRKGATLERRDARGVLRSGMQPSKARRPHSACLSVMVRKWMFPPENLMETPSAAPGLPCNGPLTTAIPRLLVCCSMQARHGILAPEAEHR